MLLMNPPAVPVYFSVFFFFSSRRRHTRCLSDWSSDVCSSDIVFHPHCAILIVKFDCANAVNFAGGADGAHFGLTRCDPVAETDIDRGHGLLLNEEINIKHCHGKAKSACRESCRQNRASTSSERAKGFATQSNVGPSLRNESESCRRARRRCRACRSDLLLLQPILRPKIPGKSSAISGSPGECGS